MSEDDHKLGATGEFPRGKLAKDDEGELSLAVAAKDGSVMIAFGKSVSWIGMGPDDAEQLANIILERAKEAREQTH